MTWNSFSDQSPPTDSLINAGKFIHVASHWFDITLSNSVNTRIAVSVYYHNGINQWVVPYAFDSRGQIQTLEQLHGEGIQYNFWQELEQPETN